MLTRDEHISRRCARMEALTSDLAGLPPGYVPTEQERARAAELRAYLGLIFDPKPVPEPEKDAPEPEANVAAKPEPAPAKVHTEGRKPKSK